MPNWTVSDIKAYLQRTGDSPEKFAKTIQLSNMTIRRWIKRSPDFKIPEKYHPLLDLHLGKLEPDEASAPQLEIQEEIHFGENFTKVVTDLKSKGEAIADPVTLSQDLRSKLEDPKMDQVIKSQVSKVLKFIRSPKSTGDVRAICTGALLYLLNPLDYIPDITPMVGYLDDYGILVLTSRYIRNLIPKF